MRQEMNIIHDETPAPYVPSDDELNRAVAEVCGWVNIARQPYGFSSVLCGINPDSDLLEELPNYCTDRNALPELLDAVLDAGKWRQVLMLLLPSRRPIGFEAIWQLMILKPRRVVVACLKAMDRWRDTWRTE